jgi:hypothetical protein
MGGEFRTGRYVTLESIVEDAIRWVQLIPLLSQERTGLPANAVGIVYSTPYTFEAPAGLLERARAVYLEAHIEASDPDSITQVHLADVTAAVSRGLVEANAGARLRSADVLPALVAGNEHGIVIRVSQASANPAATTGVRAVRAIVVLGAG